MIFSIIASPTDRLMLRDVNPHSAMNSISLLHNQATCNDRRGSFFHGLSGRVEVGGSGCVDESIINSLRFGNERINGINVGTVEKGEIRTREVISLPNAPEDTTVSTSLDGTLVSEIVKFFTRLKHLST